MTRLPLTSDQVAGSVAIGQLIPSPVWVWHPCKRLVSLNQWLSMIFITFITFQSSLWIHCNIFGPKLRFINLRRRSIQIWGENHKELLSFQKIIKNICTVGRTAVPEVHSYVPDQQDYGLRKPERLIFSHRNQVRLTDFQIGRTEFQFVSTRMNSKSVVPNWKSVNFISVWKSEPLWLPSWLPFMYIVPCHLP